MPGSLYNVASGRPLPLLDVLEVLGDTVGRRLSLNFEDTKRGDVRDTHASTELVRADLGYAPATTVRDGIAAQVAEAQRRRDLLAAAA
jgi:UDP-glucuronate 4-epimerase